MTKCNELATGVRGYIPSMKVYEVVNAEYFFQRPSTSHTYVNPRACGERTTTNVEVATRTAYLALRPGVPTQARDHASAVHLCTFRERGGATRPQRDPPRHDCQGRVGWDQYMKTRVKEARDWETIHTRSYTQAQ